MRGTLAILDWLILSFLLFGTQACSCDAELMLLWNVRGHATD
jgi:hypothetical protein